MNVNENNNVTGSQDPSNTDQYRNYERDSLPNLDLSFASQNVRYQKRYYPAKNYRYLLT